MKRARAGRVLGLSLLLAVQAALLLSCGSADNENLFTAPHLSRPGTSNLAGATSSAGNGDGGSSDGSAGTAGAGGNRATAGLGGTSDRAGASGAGAAGHPSAGSSSSAGSSGAASAGAGGTSGTGGSSGGAAGGAGKSGGGGAGGASGALCLDNQACKDGEYCAKPGCLVKSEGHCTARPSDCANSKLAVVCGCDGVTYHDSCLLHLNGQNSAEGGSGACGKAAAGTVTCSTLDDTDCKTHGGICGFRAEATCGVEPVSSKGICWVLPESCPGSDDHTVLLCNVLQDSCGSECDAIKGKQRYVLADSCK